MNPSTIGGRTGSTAAIALLGLVGSLSAAWAQDAVYHDLADPRGYWSESRLESAADLDLPLAPASVEALLELQSDDLETPFEDEPKIEKSSTLPDDVDPDLETYLYPEYTDEVLLEGADVDDVESQDFGTFRALFSSSRLIPTSARTTFPYSTVGKLFFTQPGVGNFVCSGAVIDDRLVVTAGHCVHRGNNRRDGFFTNFLFVPAFHNGQAPFGSWRATSVVVSGSWFGLGDDSPVNRADFAILVMQDRRIGGQVRSIGDVTGELGFRTNSLAFNHTKKLGYPGNLDRGQIMHQVDSQHLRNAARGTVLYGSDMRGGSSGGPWVQDFGATAAGQGDSGNYFRNRLVGVTSYGFIATGPKVQGSSTLNGEFASGNPSRPGVYEAACASRAGSCQ